MNPREIPCFTQHRDLAARRRRQAGRLGCMHFVQVSLAVCVGYGRRKDFGCQFRAGRLKLFQRECAVAVQHPTQKAASVCVQLFGFALFMQIRASSQN